MNAHERKLLDYTIYLEARGREEPDEGQKAIVHSILNRAKRPGWAYSVAGVILQPLQFECWNGRVMNGHIAWPTIHEPQAMARAKRNVTAALAEYDYGNPRGCYCWYCRGADHYNNPSKESAPWVVNVKALHKIGSHQFYVTPEYANP